MYALPSKYVGLGCSSFVFDGTVSATPVSGVEVSGSGTLSLVPLVSGGGLSLAVGAHPGAVAYTLPASVRDGVRAVRLIVDGISHTGLRPTLKMFAKVGVNDVGIRSDEMGVWLVSGTAELCLMKGNLVAAADGYATIDVDFRQKKVTGMYGGSTGSLPMNFTGVTSFSVSNETKSSPAYANHSATLKRVAAQVVWNRPGVMVEKVL